ncbi:ferritin-like domain-containing protein [Lachancea thermotolerans CBS 6340]|uniref:KLTH0E00286p n=1 Tax=Lachancea thermotolerans (strain ATCC 56472 / CBS 6340 / NRRL Y-8284) TaxID=559295 RepID=C5DH04_LACTC|nr:KLTH0E00286p [Lachancea thermotolerans CBS 6340]CAR23065.1 KLTH0E00286p [Lachancea thermotolerans CBS 6340]
MYSFFVFGFFFLAIAASFPLYKRANLDVDILQFALTLERLENKFYKEALSMWSVDDFVDANFTEDFYTQLKYIVHDEEAHLVFLEQTIRATGAEPVQACTYKLPLDGPAGFVKNLATFEGVGVSAYLGAASLISSKKYLTVAGSILSAEAIHQAAARNAIGEIPMANPFATPLSANAIYSIASQFIESCPVNNTKLPFKAYPELFVTQGLPTAMNSSITFASNGTLPNSTQIYVTFVSGLDVIPVAGSRNGSSIRATVPEMVSGQSYVFLTTGNSSNLTDSNILYGPAIIEVTPSSPTFNVSIF